MMEKSRSKSRSRSANCFSQFTKAQNEQPRASKKYFSCQSHVFVLKRIGLRENRHQDDASVNYAHCDRVSNPVPGVMRKYLEIPYIPMFGFEEEKEHYQKSMKLYKQAYDKELDRNTQESMVQNNRRSERIAHEILKAVPKNKTCQVCRVSFEDYEKHCDEKCHKRNVQDSFGGALIEDQIEEINSSLEKYSRSENYKMLEKTRDIAEQTKMILKQVKKSFMKELSEMKQNFLQRKQ